MRENDPKLIAVLLVVLVTAVLVGHSVYTKVTQDFAACRDVNGSVVQSGELLVCEFENGSRVPLGSVVNESETG